MRGKVVVNVPRLLGSGNNERARGRCPYAFNYIPSSMKWGVLSLFLWELLSSSSNMRLFLCNAVLTLLVTSLSGALIPEPEVKIEVLQKPFICHRKTKGGDLMLVHYEGYLEKDGSLFHST